MSGLSTLAKAIAWEQFDIVFLILNDIDATQAGRPRLAREDIDKQLDDSLDIAIDRGYIEIVRRLIKMKAPLRTEHLTNAILKRRINITQLLIDNKCPASIETLNSAFSCAEKHLDEIFELIDLAAEFKNKTCSSSVLLKTMAYDRFDISHKMIAAGCPLTLEVFERAVICAPGTLLELLLERKCPMSYQVLERAISSTRMSNALMLLRDLDCWVSSDALVNAIGRDQTTVIDAILQHPRCKLSADAMTSAIRCGNIALTVELITRNCPKSHENLVLAIDQSHESLADIMLDNNYEPSAITLKSAIIKGYIALARRMAPRIDPTTAPQIVDDALSNGHTAFAGELFELKFPYTDKTFNLAVMNNAPDLALGLLSAKCTFQRSAFDHVIMRKYFDVAKELIRRGCFTRARDLDYVIAMESKDIRYTEIKELMVENGCPMSDRTRDQLAKQKRAKHDRPTKNKSSSSSNGIMIEIDFSDDSDSELKNEIDPMIDAITDSANWLGL